jgi:hypothetical protein
LLVGSPSHSSIYPTGRGQLVCYFSWRTSSIVRQNKCGHARVLADGLCLGLFLPPGTTLVASKCKHEQRLHVLSDHVNYQPLPSRTDPYHTSRTDDDITNR